jgi:GNAT superfamily N-acetyltransferase
MASSDRLVFNRGILWSAQLGELEAKPLGARIPAEYGRVDKDTIAQLMRATGQMDPIAPEAIRRRFNLGSQCFAAHVAGSIVAYGWLTRGPEWIGEYERELKVREGEAYVWDCATLPAYRRQRLFSALLGHIAGQLRQEGLQRLWIFSVRVSPALARGLEAAGFQPLVSVSYLRLLDRHLLLATPQPGATGVQLDAARHLIKKDDEKAFGRLLSGNSSIPTPPDTHFDG